MLSIYVAIWHALLMYTIDAHDRAMFYDITRIVLPSMYHLRIIVALIFDYVAYFYIANIMYAKISADLLESTYPMSAIIISAYLSH